MNPSTWQILLVTYVIGVPLVALHMRWVLARADVESPDKRRETNEVQDMMGLSRSGLVVSMGMLWPLIIVGYVMQLVTGRRL